MFGIGGSSSSSKNSSSSQSTQGSASYGTSFGNNSSQSGSFIDPTQGGFLQNLWAQATSAADPAAAGGAAASSLGQILPGLQAAFGNLGGMTDPSAMIQQQAGALSEGLGNLFRNEINPTIEGNAIGAGGFGGGRQGVAQGVAAGQLGDSYASGLADITSAANNQALQASTALAGLGNSIFSLGQQGQTAGLDILGQLSGILGGPTVLQNSTATGTTGSQQGSVSAGQSTSKSKGKSGSSSFNLGF